MPHYPFRDRYPVGFTRDRRWATDKDGDPTREFADIFEALDAAALHPDRGGFFPSINNVEFGDGFDMRTVPVVESPDAAILDLMRRFGGVQLLSDRWHDESDDGAHDRGGWVIHMAGEDGYAIEEKYGPKVAASLIYAASCPGLTVPNWFVYGEQCLEDLRRRAEAWAAGPPFPDIPWEPMDTVPWTPAQWAARGVVRVVSGKNRASRSRVAV